MINKIESYLKKKVDCYEIYYEENSGESFELSKNTINSCIYGDIKGLGVRVFKDSRLGFASSLNINNYKDVVDKALKIAKLNEKDKNFKNFVSPSKYPDVKVPNGLIDFNEEEIKKYINKTFKMFNDEEITLARGKYKKVLGNRKIINSEGLDVHDKFSYNIIDYNLIDKEGNSLWGGAESRSLLNYERQKEHIERMKALKIKDIPKTNDMELLLYPEALGSLLNSMVFNINGENVVNKKSIFVGKLGEKIFDSKLNIIDSGLGSNFNSRKCDDEGFPTKETKIIEEGVLKGFLFDSYNANIMVVENTGNASRNYSVLPQISTNNFFVCKGNDNIKDMIGSMKKGIFVKELLGAHTMDSLTGDFSLGINEGHVVEDGRMKYAVTDCMISGNIFNLLKNISEISNDEKHVGGGYYLPNMLFEKIKVIGN